MDNIIKSLRKKSGLTQQELSDKLCISRSAVAMWETGKSSPTNDELVKLAKFFGVSTDSILGNDTLPDEYSALNNSSGKNKKALVVPVLGKVAAGIPLSAITDILDYEEIDKAMAGEGEYFALKLTGNSMEPRMKDGDVVIVKKQDSVENGDISVVLVGNDATVKRVIIHENGMGISLIPLNTAHEPMYIPPSRLSQGTVRILGKVVELRAKF